MSQQRILVVDDNAINRMLLKEMLQDDFLISEAVDGEEALEMIDRDPTAFDLVLLDIMMPKKTGTEVLETLAKENRLETLPVIMISAENSTASIRKAYEMGAEDYIDRPFDPATVLRRIHNSIAIHTKQKELLASLRNEFDARQRQNDLMVSLLSHIVEYRNGESGAHVLHINIITGMLLEALANHTDKYAIPPEDYPIIRNASSFHDIGKIGIPLEIINKPGRLTDEEFATMKTHSAIGADMLERVVEFKDEPLVKYSLQICRWHHERYDGRGYPDGLKGDDIPIAAQIVSLADVYDALTSIRCYKPAFTHKEAVHMIFDGQCGTFNEVLLQAFSDIEDKLEQLIGEGEGNLMPLPDDHSDSALKPL